MRDHSGNKFYKSLPNEYLPWIVEFARQKSLLLESTYKYEHLYSQITPIFVLKIA